MQKKNGLVDYDQVTVKNKAAKSTLSVLIHNNIEKNSFIVYLGTKTASIIENLDCDLNFPLERIK
jgi:hypothetical protein